jgi:hypothetical protein
VFTTFNSHGDSCDVYYNTHFEPFFVDPLTFNFALQSLSHCIDAGDPALPLDPDGSFADMGAVYFDQSSPVKPGETVSPAQFKLLEVYPNPFNPSTVASYQLQVAGYVSLKVYDTAGRLVATLVEGWRSAGKHEVTFEGKGLPSGVYMYCLQTGENVVSGKMVLLK